MSPHCHCLHYQPDSPIMFLDSVLHPPPLCGDCFSCSGQGPQFTCTACQIGLAVGNFSNQARKQSLNSGCGSGIIRIPCHPWQVTISQRSSCQPLVFSSIILAYEGAIIIIILLWISIELFKIPKANIHSHCPSANWQRCGSQPAPTAPLTTTQHPPIFIQGDVSEVSCPWTKSQDWIELDWNSHLLIGQSALLFEPMSAQAGEIAAQLDDEDFIFKSCETKKCNLSNNKQINHQKKAIVADGAFFFSCGYPKLKSHSTPRVVEEVTFKLALTFFHLLSYLGGEVCFVPIMFYNSYSPCAAGAKFHQPVASLKDRNVRSLERRTQWMSGSQRASLGF